MTEFIIGGRAAGKTQRLLEQMLVDPEMVYMAHDTAAAQWAYERYIVMLEERAGTIRRDAIKRESIRARFVSADSARHTLLGLSPDRRLVVDNVDLAFQRLFGRYPDIITGTGTITTISHEGNADDH